jgi:hypothetical protein
MDGPQASKSSYNYNQNIKRLDFKFQTLYQKYFLKLEKEIHTIEYSQMNIHKPPTPRPNRVLIKLSGLSRNIQLLMKNNILPHWEATEHEV